MPMPLRTPALDRPHLLAEPTRRALLDWKGATDVRSFEVIESDPDVADTAAFCARYGATMEQSANCVVLVGKRGDTLRYTACIVLATTRADINGVVRKLIDARKVSFAPMDTAVAMTNMEFGGITPFGLPVDWPIYVDARVADLDQAVVGSGIRASKLFVPGAAIAEIPTAQVIQNLASVPISEV